MRYTKKEEDFDFDDNNKIYYFDEYIVPEHSKIYDAVDKLGQLEDIEDNLPAFNGLQHLFANIENMELKGEELHFTYNGKQFAIRKE